MRALLAALLLSSSLLTGCTPYIPVKDDFGTSALAPAGDIPPEFAEFNSYEPRVNALLAQQICATPYQAIDERGVAAAAGRLEQARWRCATHIPLYAQ